MKLFTRIFFSVVLIALMACGHGSFGKGQMEGDTDSNAVHIAVLPIEECNPLRVAQECGLFDTLDCVVVLDTFLSAMDADTAFVKGQVHLLVTDSLRAAYLATVLGDSALATVHSDTLQLSMMTSRPSRIKSPKQLKEKIVAVTRNSVLDYFADKVMDQAKLQREELNRPQINDITLRAKMLSLNQYDGAILPEPFATECDSAGANRIATLKEPLMRIVVRSDCMKERVADIKTIVNAYKKARYGAKR